MIIGGYTLSPECGKLQIPLVHQSTMEEVKSIIYECGRFDGVTSLSVTPVPEVGPCEINLYADSGNYLLMLNQYLDDGEHVARTLNNTSAGTKLIDVLGDCYQANLITRDIGLVVSCFQGFLSFGDVSALVLSV